jgi:simple sugar transport system ATP-binding protein
MRRGAAEALEQLGVRIPRVTAPISMLSGGQRQCVAVARAVIWATNVVILDEPTAALGVVQTQRVLDVVERVREAGMSVVLVSHNMPQVLQVADRVEVLRLGRRTARFKSDEATTEDLVAAMTGAFATEVEAWPGRGGGGGGARRGRGARGGGAARARAPPPGRSQIRWRVQRWLSPPQSLH